MEAWKEEMLMHDGTKGMRWHVRRYRNEDGTLTDAGRLRYGVGPARDSSPAALTTRSGLTNRTVKISSSVKRLDNPSTDDLISSTKKLIGEPSENEKLTDQFFKDVYSKGKPITLDDLEKYDGDWARMDSINKNLDDADAVLEKLSTKGEFFDYVREAPSINIADEPRFDNAFKKASDIDGEKANQKNNAFKKASDIDGEKANQKNDAFKKASDIDGEKANQKNDAFKKADDINGRKENQKTSHDSNDRMKKEKSTSKSDRNDNDDAGSKSAFDPEAARKARLERRADIIAKGKAYGTIADEGGKIANNLGTIYGKRQKMHRMNAIDYSQMSNDDLRARTERLNLERNYREAVGNNIGNHERRVTTFLETAGAALAVTGSAVSIAMAIKQLRNG